MRKELYNELCKHLRELYHLPDGSVCHHVEGTDVPEGAERIIKHIDLWNHNVEFIEQEENWARPAVFVEFCPIQWQATVPGVRYTCEPLVKLHIVTDWSGSSAAGSDWQDEALQSLTLSRRIHEVLCGMEGESFMDFDLVETQTNHNHEDVVENVEIYSYVGLRKLHKG